MEEHVSSELKVPRLLTAKELGSGDGEELCYYHYRLWRSEDGGLTFYLVAESITIAPC